MKQIWTSYPRLKAQTYVTYLQTAPSPHPFPTGRGV